jgi:hypothetical protein
MSEKEFLIYLDEAQENRYRYWHVWEQDAIVEFRIQYESIIEGHWHPVVRYDSAHGRPHRDILHPNAPETKDWYPGYRNADVLSIGQRDIVANWPGYRVKYERELYR